MKKTVVLSALALFTQNLPAETATSQDQQNKLYVRCLIENKADPVNIPREVSETCLVRAGVPDVGEAKRKKTSKTWRDCLYQQIVMYDDGVSPTSQIAQSLLPLCANEWRGFVESFWMYPEARLEMASNVKRYGADEGVRAVLLVRKTRKSMK